MPQNRIDRREFLQRSAALGLGAGALAAASCVPTPPTPSWDRPPNIIVLFADDMGYGDWDLGGHPTIRTPNLDRMAEGGTRFTQFYCGAPVCSPSRSSLLTGRNFIRTGVLWVFFPQDHTGMAKEEVTIAECLKPRGYATGCIGKWHLGDDFDYRPMRQGFDYYYGLLYSNDMKNADLWRNDERIEAPADQTTLTRRYTEEAEAFIERNKDQQFFLYLPYTFPHIPLFASDEFKDTSLRGLYGDVVQELDWSVGRIMDKLASLGLSHNTLVMFTSDNGPWMTQNERGGSAGMLRGAKGDCFEGGMRVPFVAQWPGTIPAGTVNTSVGSVLDFLPTCAGLAGAEVPTDRPIDGIDLMPALRGESMPERVIYFYQREHLNAVRQGKWKLHFRIHDPNRGGYTNPVHWVEPESPLLYDLEVDPAERFDLAAKNPEVVARLTELAESYKDEIERLDENRELKDWFMR